MHLDAIIVLAHLMEKDGTLGIETKRRADKAAELARLSEQCAIILMGWDYRDDTDLCISDAIARYLQSAHHIEPERLLIDRDSRDTVGDAILSKKKFLHRIGGNCITVVTSDYHQSRTRKIFEYVYGADAMLSVVGILTEHSEQHLEHEQASIQAFARTFAGVKCGDDQAAFDVLIRHHPFYNGETYPALEL